MSQKQKKTPDPLDVKIGKKVKLYRQVKSMTQAELGTQLGVSRLKIGQYENGSSSIPSPKLFKMSKIFDIDMDHFFKEISEDFPIHVIETLDPKVSRQALQILHALSEVQDPDVIKEFLGILDCYAQLINGKKPR